MRSIIGDIETEDLATTTTPSLRFVTRMIPIQTTCYASLVEMRHTMRGLLKEKLIRHGMKRRGEQTDDGDYTLPTFIKDPSLNFS